MNFFSAPDGDEHREPSSQPLFTLRPLARTEPPGAPVKLSRPRLGLGLALGIGLLTAVAAGAATGSREPVRTEPVVFVHGAPKPKQTSAGAELRWWRDELTIVFDASLEQMGPGGREAAKAAFGAWIGSGAKLPRLFYEDRAGLLPSLEPDGVSSVVYAPIELPGHKQALAVSISHVSPATGAIVEVDVIVNSERPFAVLGGPDQACSGRYDLQNVLTHEAGHFFGLDEDAGDPATTMFYKTGLCELHKRDLSASDESALTELYARDRELGAAHADAGCAVRAPRAGSWAGIITALALVLGLARARARAPRMG